MVKTLPATTFFTTETFILLSDEERGRACDAESTRAAKEHRKPDYESAQGSSMGIQMTLDRAIERALDVMVGRHGHVLNIESVATTVHPYDFHGVRNCLVTVVASCPTCRKQGKRTGWDTTGDVDLLVRVR